MFEWPRFAAHLDGIRSPKDRVGSLLADLAESVPTPSAKDVLSALFEDAGLVNAVQHLASRIDHVGFVAPPDLGVAAVADILSGSAFRHQLRTFKSAVLAKDLSSRFGRGVDVMVMQGNAVMPSARFPSVEVFIADLPAQEIENLVVQETGCHVALALVANSSFARVLEVLHAHGCWEIPVMRDGPLANYEIHSSVLYVDVSGGERTRRLEFIAPDTPAS